MRLWVMAAVALLAAPAFGQTVSGTASVAEAPGLKIEQMLNSGGFTRTGMREVIQIMLEGGLDNTERDFLQEMATGLAIAVNLEKAGTDGGLTVQVPQPPVEVVMQAQLITATPNLNTLWCQAGVPADAFFELARMSPAAEQRLYSYIGNMLDDAWKQSTVKSMFIEYTRMLNCGWGMMESLPEDKEMRGFAYDLVMTGVAAGVEKAKAEGRSPPVEALYSWMAAQERRDHIVNGKQTMLAPAAPE